MAAFALLSFLAKKSGNKRIINLKDYVFNQLKDKQRVAQHENYIKTQQSLLEKRQKDIETHNRFMNSESENIEFSSKENIEEKTNVPKKVKLKLEKLLIILIIVMMRSLIKK